MPGSVTPKELSDLLRRDSAAVFVLDVREDDERAAARIEPSTHIPMAEVPSRLAEIPKGRRVVVYCHHGSRSGMVAGFLSTHGYSQVDNLDGGIDAWARTVDPEMPRY